MPAITKVLALSTLVSVYPGCSGSPVPPHVSAGGTGGNLQVTGGSSQVAGAGSQLAGTGVVGTGTGGTSAAAASGGGPVGQCLDGSAPPSTAGSVQTVSVTLRNASSGIKYVSTAGYQCTTFAIQRLSSSDWLTLDVKPVSCNGQCGSCTCEEGSAVPSAVLALEPGDTYSFDWDARSYASCSTPIAECPDQTQQLGAKQPVAPGAYRLFVPIANGVPASCSPTSDAGRYVCSPGGMSSCGSSWSMLTCIMETATAIEFTLPESGDLQVELPL